MLLKALKCGSTTPHWYATSVQNIGTQTINPEYFTRFSLCQIISKHKKSLSMSLFLRLFVKNSILHLIGASGLDETRSVYCEAHARLPTEIFL